MCGKKDAYDDSINRHNQNYWTLERVASEFIDLLNIGNFRVWPTKKDIIKLGRGDLLGALARFDNYSEFKKLLETKYGIKLEKKEKIIKWPKERILSEILPICGELGYFPSMPELDEMGKADLRGAIERYGQKEELVRASGFPYKYEYLNIKKSGYWLDWKNVESELTQISKKLGRFPQYTDLIILGRIDIIGALKHHGGIGEVAKKLGYDSTFKNSYITRDGHCVRSVFEVIIDNFLFLNEIDHKVGEKIDKKASKSYLYDFLLKNFNNIDIYIEVWGYRYGRDSTTVERSYNTKRAFKEKFYRERNLYLVSIEEKLFNKPFIKIWNHLINLCREHKIKQDGFYSKPDKIEALIANYYSYEELFNDLKPYIDELGGHMPTTTFLRKKKEEGLITRVLKFGGFNEIKNRFNLNNVQRKRKWEDDQFFMEELIPICENLGRMPNDKELLVIGRGDLLGAINKRGGVQKLSAELGYRNKRKSMNIKESGYWQKWENLENELLPICEKLGRFPTRRELVNYGIKGVEAHYHLYGGQEEIARRLGFKTFYQQTRPNLKNFSFIRHALEELISETGQFPSPSDLTNKGFDNIKQAINKYHGGFEKVAAEMGYDLKYTPKNKFKNWNYVENELKKIMQILGHFPTKKELQSLGFTGLGDSLNRYYGGFRKVRQLLEMKL